MERRTLGSTGLHVSALGLGCGAVGGLMVRGAPADQDQAIGRALDAGITFFDTAPLYGDGSSETNLGRTLAALAAGRDVVVATKVRLGGSGGDVAGRLAASLDASLRRLGRDRVDLLQLHDQIGPGDDAIDPHHVIEEVAPAFERLRAAGKIGWAGITAFGDADAVEAVLDSAAFQTAQVAFNLLVAPGRAGQARLARASAAGMGTIGIRVLAGGALSGSAWRHPIATPEVAPMGTGPGYDDDVAAAGRFGALVDRGWAASMPEAALRFALGEPNLSTVLIGVATVEQLETAIAAAERGPLPAEALPVIEDAWAAITPR